jgi:hypothetical protein
VTGAENPQERLVESRGWVIGFVDGEGCFSIGFVRQPCRPGRSGYTTGYQVTHDFVVTQGAISVGCLEELRDFFGVGQVTSTDGQTTIGRTCTATRYVEDRIYWRGSSRFFGSARFGQLNVSTLRSSLLVSSGWRMIDT